MFNENDTLRKIIAFLSLIIKCFMTIFAYIHIVIFIHIFALFVYTINAPTQKKK